MRIGTRAAVGLALLFFTACLPRAAAVELRLWDEEQPAVQTLLDEVIADFHAKEPGIRVKRSHYQTEDLRAQFQRAAMADSGAEIVLAPNDFAGVFSVMGIIQPVDGWARMERFGDAAVAAITDGKKRAWGVPINHGNHLILYVNKAMIGKVPATLEEMVAAARPLTDRKGRRFGLAWNSREPFWFVPFLSVYGERPLVGTTPNLETAATSKALALVAGWTGKERITPEDCDLACADTLFKERRAAMTINGDWAIGDYARALGEDLALAPLPRSTETGRFPEPMISGKYLMLRAGLKSEALAAARAFVEYMTSEATQRRLAQSSKRLPSLKNLLAPDGPLVRDDPLLRASVAAAAHAQPMPMAVEMRAVWDAIRPELQDVMAGRRDPTTAAGRMQKAATTRLREIGH